MTTAFTALSPATVSAVVCHHQRGAYFAIGYVYRALLTGIHLMRTGEVEANLLRLNELFKLPHLAGLVARRLAGPENLAVGQLLDAEIAFHEPEYLRLRAELQAAHEAGQLPETPSGETRQVLNDLLVRIRLCREPG